MTVHAGVGLWQSVRIEARKIVTNGATWLALAAAAVVVGVLAILYTVFASEIERAGAQGLAISDVLLNVYLTGFRFGFIASVLWGVSLSAGELRSGVLLLTLIRDGQRARTFAAKAVAALVGGAACGTVLLAVSTGVGLVGAAIAKAPTRMDDAGVAGQLGMAVLAHALLAVVGVGVGTLIRRQLIAVVAALTWFLLIDGVVAGILGQVPHLAALGSVLPGSLVTSLSATGVVAPGGVDVLGRGQALLGLAAYATAFCVLGVWALARRDLTVARDR